MNPQTQPSFIPKKPLVGVGSQSGSLAFGSLFFLLSVLIFVASLVSAGAVFAYKGYLTGAIANKTESLGKAQAAFDPGAIQDLLRMDSRLSNAKILLKKHVAPSGLFAFLSAQTLQRVSFNSFSYAVGDDGSVTVALSGQADGFATLALQSDQFNTNKLLKDAIFSSIAVVQGGQVTFNVKATVDPSLVSYENSIMSTSISASATPAQNTPVPAAPLLQSSGPLLPTPTPASTQSSPAPLP